MPHRWSRRQLVQGAGAVGLTLLAGCGRLPGQALSSMPVPRLGLLGLRSLPPLVAAFREGLREFGYVEGQNIIVEHRIADGRLDRLSELAAELVRERVDVIVAENNPAAIVAKQATSTIPIVMANGDPVGTGLAASLARPGGNVTGLTAFGAELGGKRLEILKEAFPGVRQVAVVWNPTNPVKRLQWTESLTAAHTLSVQLHSVEVQAPEHLEPAFATVSQQPAEALLVFADEFTASYAGQIVALANASRLPTMYDSRPFMDPGGLMAYGPILPALYRRAAYYVDRILKGANPADLPIEQPMRFDFVINLKTAQALGLTIPHHVLAQATEVIQ
jgi:putative tryptophan/tyrosine transport system substrate-binding protein